MLPLGQLRSHPNHRHHQPQLLSWLQEQQRPGRLRNIMEKERNQQFLRQAQDKGYLQSPIEASVVQAARENDPHVNSVKDVLMVRLSGIHLRDVGAVGLCSQLRVCNLSGNYIKSFDGLAGCQRLVKLDLHSNQINQLPGEKFWAGMKELRVLYLHDNSISRLDYLQAVGAASILQVLTLYDTPISLKMTYRHHVVNSVWSLKSLDRHVVSDEEIIEDAFFGGHFSMLNPAFSINPVMSSKQNTTLGEELAHMRSVLCKVSSIQAKHSPVLIIQRYIRGWLTRKAFKIFARTKTWALVTIQRFWRAYKGLEWKPPSEQTGRAAPPTTAEFTPVPHPKPAATHPTPTHPTKGGGGSPGPAISVSATEASSSRMDYDTYLRNRRPGSKSPNMAALLDHQRRLSETQARLKEEKESSVTPTTAETTARRRANMVVRMSQLHSDLHMASDNESLFEDLARERAKIGLGRTTGQDVTKHTKPKAQKKKRKKSRTVGQMLGTLSDSELLRDSSPDEWSDKECEVSSVKFRLSGLRPVLNRMDPLQETLISKREAGKDVRLGLAAYYTQKHAKAQPVRKPVHKKPMNADQKLFARAQGTMGMSCLKAVLQAYRDRENSDKLSAKVDKVSQMREQREEGRMRAKSFLEEKRVKALQRRDKEIGRISHEYEQQANREIENLEKQREIRTKDSEITARVHKENTFSHDFGSQHTSISNALLRHDRQARVEKALIDKQDFVQAEHTHEVGQFELVRRYLEHRQLMRQAQVAVEKAALDTRMMQESSDRIMDARANVSRQKEKARRFRAFYPLPKCPTHPVLPPVRREGKPDQWNTLISMYEGRVGNHPAVIGTI